MNTLARLAIKTGQIDRAIQRLETSLALEPENQSTICLLAAAYGNAGPDYASRAAEMAVKCDAQ